MGSKQEMLIHFLVCCPCGADISERYVRCADHLINQWPKKWTVPPWIWNLSEDHTRSEGIYYVCSQLVFIC